jgi:hypothetical protein
VGDAPADGRVSLAGVHRDVHVVDASVEHRVEEALGLAWPERLPDPRDPAAQLEGPDTQDSPGHAGPTEDARGKIGHGEGSSLVGAGQKQLRIEHHTCVRNKENQRQYRAVTPHALCRTKTA